MILAFRSYRWTIFLFLLCVVPSFAQSKSQIADSVKKMIADHRSRLAAADSSGEDEEAMFIRLELSKLVKAKEATALLEEAVANARTGDPGTEMMVRTQLAEHYEKVGNYRLAYAEAMAIVALGDEELTMQKGVSSRSDKNMLRAQAERDSLQRVWNAELAETVAIGSAAQERGQRWMLVAAGIGVLFLLTLLVVLYRSGQANKRFRAELDALRTEIVALKERRTEARIPASPPIAAAPPSAEVPVVAPFVGPPPVAEIDHMVVAMFKKMGPERLATLRDARARGDEAKVTRVVHTLKPQLVNFDPFFAELCARLTAPGAASNVQQWNTDLDAFEERVGRLLA